jgi:ubiquinone/menaquinone biosynthesis C-methylase UbiE
MKPIEYDAFAEFYDFLYPRTNHDDVPFYRELAQEKGTPILEVGCGTGQLLLPLARAGVEITGLDISEKMLEVTKNKLVDEREDVRKRIDLVQGDMRQFNLTRSFNCCFVAYSSFLELNSEAECLSALKCIHTHLEPGGVLALDNFLYGEGEYKDWGRPRPNYLLRHVKTIVDPTHPGCWLSHTESDVIDASTSTTKRCIFLERFKQGDGVTKYYFEVNRIYISPKRIKELLLQAGFKNIELYGGFDRKPLYDESYKGKARQIFIAEK